MWLDVHSTDHCRRSKNVNSMFFILLERSWYDLYIDIYFLSKVLQVLELHTYIHKCTFLVGHHSFLLVHDWQQCISIFFVSLYWYCTTTGKGCYVRYHMTTQVVSKTSKISVRQSQACSVRECLTEILPTVGECSSMSGTMCCMRQGEWAACCNKWNGCKQIIHNN